MKDEQKPEPQSFAERRELVSRRKFIVSSVVGTTLGVTAGTAISKYLGMKKGIRPKTDFARRNGFDLIWTENPNGGLKTAHVELYSEVRLAKRLEVHPDHIIVYYEDGGVSEPYPVKFDNMARQFTGAFMNSMPGKHKLDIRMEIPNEHLQIPQGGAIEDDRPEGIKPRVEPKPIDPRDIIASRNTPKDRGRV